MMESIFALSMFLTLILLIASGYPVALCLAASSLIFGTAGHLLGLFSFGDFGFLPSRIWGIMNNVTLMAVPLFIAMGLILERCRIAEDILLSFIGFFNKSRTSLAYAIILVGALLAATTGIVGATVVTLAVIALPIMLKQGYQPSFASGLVAASGTLGQIIPPSIVLILLADLMSVDVGDLFVASLTPALILVGLYLLYVWLMGHFAAHKIMQQPVPSTQHRPIDADLSKQIPTPTFKTLVLHLIPPLLLMVVVLGSILFGLATPSESASCGAFGAWLIACAQGRWRKEMFAEIGQQCAQMTAMVFFILVGAQMFAIVFRGSHGEDLLMHLVQQPYFNTLTLLLLINVILFFLGFFLDFIEICFIMIPLILPILNHLGVDRLWMAVIFSLNLQTSFLTPPFGFSLFYLKGSAPPEIKTWQIYRGVMPFIFIQILVLMLVGFYPGLSRWLISAP